MKICFQNTEQQRLELDILDYERSLSGEYYDDNWLLAEVVLSVGGFQGKFNLSILTQELVNFLNETQTLWLKLSGISEFKTMESQLYLKLTGDGKGHITLEGEAIDRLGSDNQLKFCFEFDQTQLQQSISELKEAVTQFPIRQA